jgi:A/G-specific adenine glycosylase
MTKSRRILSDTLPISGPAGFSQTLIDWFDSHARNLPWRHTLDPYAIWVSEIMLQQTKVKTVVPYWERWLREFPRLEDVAHAPESRLLKLWEGLGYYSRVRNLKRAADTLLLHNGGQFPRSFPDILELPGIGRYTAGAISSIAFNQASPLLDGNVIRVLTRVLAILGDPKEKQINELLWSFAQKLVEAAAELPPRTPALPRVSSGPCSDLNQSLMELGATVCLPVAPRCAECPLNSSCQGLRLGAPEKFPESKPRPLTTARRFIAFIVEKNGMALVQQRPETGINAGLWEFPTLEAPLSAPIRPQATRPYQITSAFAVVNHSITRYRIRLEAHRATLVDLSPPEPTKWHPVADLSVLPFSSAHAKLRKQLLSVEKSEA